MAILLSMCADFDFQTSGLFMICLTYDFSFVHHFGSVGFLFGKFTSYVFK